MTNPDHLSEPDPSQLDPPYEQLSPFTQVAAEYIARGDLDPSGLSTELVHEIDSLALETVTKMKSLVYEYLSEHGEPPPLEGLRPVLQLAVLVFTEQYLAEQHNNGTPPPDTPPSPEIPQ
jgi:hypothetical protein